MKYMSVQHIWNLSQLLGLFTCRKLANLSWNFVTEMCKQRPEILSVAKNWALAMMLKALPLVHFWNVLLLKGQMMTSVRTTLKVLVRSAQNWSISIEIIPENNYKIGLFYPFSAKFAPEIAAKSADFSANLPQNWLFSSTYQKSCIALHSMARSIRFETVVDRIRYKFGGKLALFMRFGTFCMVKAKQDKMKCLVLTLLF